VYAGTLEEWDIAEDDAPDPTPADGLIDWAGAAARKWHRLQQSYQRFTQAPEALQRDLRGFEQEGGAALAAFARCNAAAMGQRDPALQVHAQWRAARSWQQAQRRAQEAGMALGLIADLAVGFTADGAEAAAAADTALRGLVLGAPPDAFAPDGQVWGIS
ncbi:4-alpha-glucanotransferase, partial [Leclercia adecarboxylata]